MIFNIHQSLIYDTKILENGIIKIPELESRTNQNVHSVIVFKQDTVHKNETALNLFGSLKKYAKPHLIDNETDLA